MVGPIKPSEVIARKAGNIPEKVFEVAETCSVCGGAVPGGMKSEAHTALCAEPLPAEMFSPLSFGSDMNLDTAQVSQIIALYIGEVIRSERDRLRVALETITRSHPGLVPRNGAWAPWLVAKAALLNMPLRPHIDSDMEAVVSEWVKTEPKIRQ